ncbi:MAG: HAD-IA family hydrolase [bacterium]|nr:HAD-IA family hydrolase [bacterium]
MIIECKAIIFDLDGTLVDSTVCVEKTWKRWAEKYNIETGVLSSIHGMTSYKTISLIAPHLDAEKATIEFDKEEIKETDGLKLIPHADKILSKLPSEKWAIATSGSNKLATTRLSYVGLPVPKILVTADDITNSKPHPEPYLLAAKYLDISPEDCVVFEDSLAGIEAAKASGAKVIGLTTLFTKEELSHTDAVINDFSDVKIHLNDDNLELHIND